MPASARRFALAASVCFLLAACGGGGGSNDNPNPNPGAPPAAPTALVATPGSAQVTLTWATVTGATSYNLYFGTSAGVTKTSGTKIQGVTSGYVHAGRTNNTTYHYVVTAVNAGGESAVSSEASATPAVNPAPAAPTNVAAAPANAQVTVSWDPVAGATSYTVYEGGPTVSKSAHAAVVTSATSPVVRSGLANGTAYYYVVTASNLNGESTDSARVSATPFPAPAAPAGVVAVAGDAQVTLTWTAVAGATSYNVYRATSTGVTKSNGTKSAGVSSGVVQTGLTNGTTYYYVVTAVNAGGESADSSEVNARPLPPAPAAPTGVAAVGGDGKVTVTWNAVSGATSYNVYRSITTGVTKSNGTKFASVTSPLVQTGLSNGTAYYYVVTAENLGGESADSAQASAAPQTVPAAPANVAAVAGNGQVTITWNAAAGATSYNLYRSTTTGVTKSNGMKFAGVSSGVVQTGLTNGTTYYYVVTAVNGAGESADSSQASAMPLPPVPGAPIGVVATPGDGQVTLTWSAVSGASKYNVYRKLGSAPTTSVYDFKDANVTSPRTQTLANGSIYYFVVTAENVSGESIASNAVSATPSAGAGYNISGTVNGPHAGGVTMALSGTASRTATTAPNGAYSFAGLPVGSYVVTPSLVGYSFDPPVPTVTISTSNQTQDFSQSSIVPAYTISGSIAYSGSRTGRIYVWALPSGCSSTECAAASTSVSRTGSSTPYSIRGLTYGAYTIIARLDNLGYGNEHATNPKGQAGPVTTSLNVTTQNLALSDPPTPALTAPTGASAMPGVGGVFVIWDAPVDGNGLQIPTSYLVTWGSDTAATNLGSKVVPALMNNWVIVDLGSGTYYFKVYAQLNGSDSAAAETGAVVVGAAGSGYSVSGTVTRPSDTTGALYVVVTDDMDVFQWVRIPSPAVSQSFTVAGVPNGNYGVYFLLDVNGNGYIDDGDLQAESTVTVSNANVTGKNATLADAGYWAKLRTSHGKQSGSSGEWYNLTFQVQSVSKQVASVAILSGQGVPLPFDLPKKPWSFEAWTNGGMTRPTIGDAYEVEVVYADGTKETGTMSVTGVSDAFPQNLTVQTTTPGSASIPLLKWEAPLVSPPGGYNYRVGFFSNAQWWYPDSDVGLPPTTTSVLYNADWTANPAALAAGVTYSWYVTVRDVYGNEAQMQQNYTVASAPAPAGDSAAFAGALQGTWSACSFTGASYQAETLVVSGLNATRSVTDFGALDSTCSGSGTPVFSIPGTFTVGSAVNATFVAATVTAYPIDLTFSGVSFYDLAYIAPNGRLYLGDSSGTNDGSSPATRPIALSTSVEFVKRGASPPPSVDYSSAIQGTWTACFADPTRDFFINFAFNGSAGTYNEWSYPSTNGTCTGTEILEASEVVTFTLGAGVWSPFDGGPDVAAQQIDYTLSDSSQAFDLVYIDTGAAPNLLYFGDTDVMIGNYPAVINSANPFTKQ